jgi:CRP-like cAMP-binding protein
MIDATQILYLKTFINQIVTPDELEWEAFLSKVSYVEYGKNEVVESKEQRVTKLHFILDGVARHYFTDDNDKEITIWISEPGGLSTDYAAFTLSEKTHYQIEAITPLKTFCIDNDSLQQLYNEFKIWERLGRLLNQQYLNDFIKRNNALLMLSAKERYEQLMQAKPHFFNLVPLKHVASYLGITIETLSRLRSNTY